MSFAEKMSLTNYQRSRSHIKGKVFKNIKRSPKKRAVLENIYKPIKMNFGEKSTEKKHEFPMKLFCRVPLVHYGLIKIVVLANSTSIYCNL
jgi:hypothetical protein